ncbi:MAG: hypothetical protein GYA33_13470 [Thermogutta sp.]|nr:hypothetical protein [Thermogutta sp.]
MRRAGREPAPKTWTAEQGVLYPGRKALPEVRGMAKKRRAFTAAFKAKDQMDYKGEAGPTHWEGRL